MIEKVQTKNLYIVMSQTGTITSRAIKLFTKAEYNHASISLSKNLNEMYSFARKYTYYPFLGCFVKEDPHSGVFKRFVNTKVKILEVEVSEDDYDNLKHKINYMLLHKNNYHYNYLGLFLAGINKVRKKSDCYYCSEFVKQALMWANVKGATALPEIVQPIHFLKIPNKEHYCGKLIDYHAS